MPSNGIAVGRDTTIVLYDPNSGGVPDIAYVTSFEAKQDSSKLKHKALDGVVKHGVEYDGWSGKIMLDRGNANLDKMQAKLEAAYYSGTNILSMTITQTIDEPDGGITQWQYPGVAITYDEAGSWSNGKFIGQTLSWCASKRILLA